MFNHNIPRNYKDLNLGADTKLRGRVVRSNLATPSHTTATGKEVYSLVLAVEEDFFPVFALFLHDVAGANAANGQELHQHWVNAKELELTTVVKPRPCGVNPDTGEFDKNEFIEVTAVFNLKDGIVNSDGSVHRHLEAALAFADWSEERDAFGQVIEQPEPVDMSVPSGYEF